MTDIMFLCDGHFRNISKGQIIRGIDASALVLDLSASHDFGGISGCQVWQSPVQNWVYESGITLNAAPYISGLAAPIVASGIWINNVFFSQSAGVSGSQFFIDYKNGRIVFNGAGIPTNSNVQVVYSYKFWRTDWKDNENAQLDIEDYGELSLKDNPYGQADIYPSGDERAHTFPCVYIDVLPNINFRPLEIGNRSLIEKLQVVFTIYSLSRVERNSALELIKNRLNLQSYLIDFNYAPIPLSGLVNTLSPVYIPYQTLVTNPTYNGHSVISWTYDIIDGSARRLDPEGPFLKGEVILDMEVYNICPLGRAPGVILG